MRRAVVAFVGSRLAASLSFVLALVIPLASLGQTYGIESSEYEEIADAKAAFDAGDYERAYDLFLSQTSSDNRQRLYYIGLMFRDGLGGRPEVEEGYYQLRLAGERGLLEAQFELGEMLVSGVLIPADVKEAVRWYRAAAQGGHTVAQTKLAVMQLRGEAPESDNLGSEDAENELPLLRDADAQFEVAEMLYSGRGVPRDFEKAARLFLAAARQGNIEAQKKLADMYLRGEGVEQDAMEAYWWLRTATAEGDPEASYSLGEFFYSGPMEHRDLELAASWFLLAAVRDHAEGAFRAGSMFENGEGNTPNIKQAIRWYQRAADRGHEGAILRLEELEK